MLILEKGSSDWVLEWKDLCGFRTHQEASEAINCELRTWYRWLKSGVPAGLYGDLVIERMEKVKKVKLLEMG